MIQGVDVVDVDGMERCDGSHDGTAGLEICFNGFAFGASTEHEYDYDYGYSRFIW